MPCKVWLGKPGRQRSIPARYRASSVLGKLFAVSLGVMGLVFSLWSDCTYCGANQVCRVKMRMVIPAHARYAFCYEAGLCTEGLPVLCWGHF